MILTRQLHERLNAGGPVIGTFFTELTSPSAVRVLANAGMDFFVIDIEHGMFSPSAIRQLIDAGVCAQLPSLVRVPEANRTLLTGILDAGAGGVILAQVRELRDVHRVVEITKYAPLGARGVHLLRPHTGFSPPSDPAQFLSNANRSVITAVQIETRQAAELTHEIAAIDGIDILYIGPADLSVALGCPFQFDHPNVRRVVQAAADACRAHGKIAACHIGDTNAIPELVDMGYRLFGYAAEMRLFMQGVAEMMSRARKAMTRRPEVSVTVARPVGVHSNALPAVGY